MAEISEEVKKFLEHKLSDSFGCKLETVIEGCKNSSRFSAWLGGDAKRVEEVLNVVKDAGMSPELFAAKEMQEGYNASWGWHNHTVPQGDPITDAKFVVQTTIDASNNMNQQPAWDDPGGGTVGVVPQSVQQEGNEHYASLGAGTIGRAYVAMTAAATWSMYYPQALTAAVNGVQDYGNPLQGCIDLIKSWGGDIGAPSSSGSQNPSSSVNTSNNSNKGNKTKGEEVRGGWFYIQNSNLWPMGLFGGSGKSSSGSSGSDGNGNNSSGSKGNKSGSLGEKLVDLLHEMAVSESSDANPGAFLGVLDDGAGGNWGTYSHTCRYTLQNLLKVFRDYYPHIFEIIKLPAGLNLDADYGGNGLLGFALYNDQTFINSFAEAGQKYEKEMREAEAIEIFYHSSVPALKQSKDLIGVDLLSGDIPTGVIRLSLSLFHQWGLGGGSSILRDIAPETDNLRDVNKVADAVLRETTRRIQPQFYEGVKNRYIREGEAAKTYNEPFTILQDYGETLEEAMSGEKQKNSDKDKNKDKDKDKRN